MNMVIFMKCYMTYFLCKIRHHNQWKKALVCVNMRKVQMKMHNGFTTCLKMLSGLYMKVVRILANCSAIVHLYHLKCISGWMNKSFTMLLQLLQDLLPLDAKLPKNCYEAKKITNKLGLGYKNIHACPNDCMLFWKEKALDESCSECGASRWAENKHSKNISKE